jgi:hypothetical protein
MEEVRPQSAAAVAPTKMTGRWLRLGCLSLLLMLMGFSAYLYQFRDRVTHSNFEKITEGMILDDVYVLLGRKPDHIVKRMRMQPFNVLGRLSLTARSPSAISGVSSELTIVVVVGDMNRVVDQYDVAPQLQPWYIRQRGRC